MSVMLTVSAEVTPLVNVTSPSAGRVSQRMDPTLVRDEKDKVERAVRFERVKVPDMVLRVVLLMEILEPSATIRSPVIFSGPDSSKVVPSGIPTWTEPSMTKQEERAVASAAVLTVKVACEHADKLAAV